jgi:hypothetical protein
MQRILYEKLPPSGSLGSEENPIKCRGVSGESEYLDCLITENGEPVYYERVCSMRKSHYKHVYDLYNLKDENGNLLKQVLLDMYHEMPDIMAPEGYVLVQEYLSKFDFMGLNFFKEFTDLSNNHISIRAFLYEVSKLLALKKAYPRYKTHPKLSVRNGYVMRNNYNWNTEFEQLCNSIIYQSSGLFKKKPIQIESIDALLRLLKTIDYRLVIDQETITKGIKTYEIRNLNNSLKLGLFVDFK